MCAVIDQLGVINSKIGNMFISAEQVTRLVQMVYK